MWWPQSIVLSDTSIPFIRIAMWIFLFLSLSTTVSTCMQTNPIDTTAIRRTVAIQQDTVANQPVQNFAIQQVDNNNAAVAQTVDDDPPAQVNQVQTAPADAPAQDAPQVVQARQVDPTPQSAALTADEQPPPAIIDDNREDLTISDEVAVAELNRDDDIIRHRQLFRSLQDNTAKTFRKEWFTGLPEKKELPTRTPVKTYQSGARTFIAAKEKSVEESNDRWDETIKATIEQVLRSNIDNTSTTHIPSTTSITTTETSTEPNTCSICPELFMSSDLNIKEHCGNWQSVTTFFSMQMDTNKGKVSDTARLFDCSRTVTCTHPHMLVKWLDSPMCDVHSRDDDTTSYTYTCNGTMWMMNGFPVQNIFCGNKINKSTTRLT